MYVLGVIAALVTGIGLFSARAGLNGARRREREQVRAEVEAALELDARKDAIREDYESVRGTDRIQYYKEKIKRERGE